MRRSTNNKETSSPRTPWTPAFLLILLLALLQPSPLLAASISPTVADAIVAGRLRLALKEIEAGKPVPEKLRKAIEELRSLNKVVASEYAKRIGKEVYFYARRHKKRGTLLKVARGRITVKTVSGKASAKWTVKISSLPIELRMRMADTSESARTLYLSISSLRSGNYDVAEACFKRFGDAANQLIAAADAKYGHIYSITKAAYSGDVDALRELLSAEKTAPNRKLVVSTRSSKTKKVERRKSNILIETIKRRQSATAALLLDNGADPNAPDSKGITPLMYAVAYFPKDMTILKKLLAKGADPTLVDEDGNSAFSGAVAMNRLPAFKLLLDAGVDINKPAGCGLTPLMLAVASNNYSMFKILMDKGADPTILHPEGWSVLDMNRKRMHPKIKAALDALSPPKRKRSAGGLSLPGVNVIPRR